MVVRVHVEAVQINRREPVGVAELNDGIRSALSYEHPWKLYDRSGSVRRDVGSGRLRTTEGNCHGYDTHPARPSHLSHDPLLSLSLGLSTLRLNCGWNPSCRTRSFPGIHVKVNCGGCSPFPLSWKASANHEAGVVPSGRMVVMTDRNKKSG
jgi:hypothetical protein